MKTNPIQRRGRKARTRLAPRQLAAARLLFAGRTILQVAQELGVNPCTIHRWKVDRLFTAEVERLSGTMPSQAHHPHKTIVPTPSIKPGAVSDPSGLHFDPAQAEQRAFARSMAKLKELQAHRRR